MKKAKTTISINGHRFNTAYIEQHPEVIEILTRDKFRCTNCGRTKNLIVNKEYNITLCKVCQGKRYTSIQIPAELPEILRLRSLNYTYREIAKLVGKSHEQVRQIYQKYGSITS